MTEQLEDICNANNLISSFYHTRKDTGWKESVQRYEMNLLPNILAAQKALRAEQYELKPYVEFQLRERGHTRNIKSLHISDRVVLHSLCGNVLVPRVRPYLIYDNGASLEGKGISFARRRFCIHLNNYYKKYGNEGYIRIFDFSKFFDNIPHQQALDQFRPFLNDAEARFLESIFKTFEVDVSDMTDEEYNCCMQLIYNSLEHKDPHKREKMMRKSVGIGNQVSQITGVYYPHQIDELAKILCSIKPYGRYMDDFYIIAQTKTELDDMTDKFMQKSRELQMFLNHKKIRTCPLDKEFVYLKTIYKMLPNGRIIKRITKDTISRERRKIRSLKRLVDNGRLTVDHVHNCYRSWRGSYKKYDSGYEILKMDNYCKSIFEEVSEI
jgi:hypothetical protein